MAHDRLSTHLSFWNAFPWRERFLEEKQNNCTPEKKEEENKTTVSSFIITTIINTIIDIICTAWIRLIGHWYISSIKSTSYPSFSIKMNWTMWTTLRISYDSKIPSAFRTLEMSSRTMYFVNLKMSIYNVLATRTELMTGWLVSSQPKVHVPRMGDFYHAQFSRGKNVAAIFVIHFHRLQFKPITYPRKCRFTNVGYLAS